MQQDTRLSYKENNFVEDVITQLRRIYLTEDEQVVLIMIRSSKLEDVLG